jgi:hydroxyquinol 1,2-dioxygenase
MTDTSAPEAVLTDAVVDRFDGTPDPRLREIMQSLVRHLHAFALDVKLDLREWEQAIGFLTAVGHITDDKRQEFILLSDTLGLSMLVDSITNGHQQGATETTVLGPFYVPPLAERPQGSDIAEGTAGTPLDVTAKRRGPQNVAKIAQSKKGLT